MKEYKFTESEEKFGGINLQQEPIGSGELVKLAAKELQWKKSTTYTVLKNSVIKAFFKNEQAIVSSLISREGYYGQQSIQEDTF